MSGSILRIVLAIKDTDLQISLEMLLSQDPGIKVVGTASDAKGFLALLHTVRPDQVILDCDLPGHLLEEMITAIKYLESKPKLLLLGKEHELKPSALQAGVDAYVVKGGPPEEIISALMN